MIELTRDGLRAIFPKAPEAVIRSFLENQTVLDKYGINHTRQRLAYFFANIEHECGGFTIPRLTENIKYTHARMAQVWPGRFPGGAAEVAARFGTDPGWQLRAFDDIYGNRMGNRKGTSDGSRYIGRGGPQWTGRDGYAALERISGLPAVAEPTAAADLSKQALVCAAFWGWKKMNKFADTGDFRGCVKVWNGGTNGMADRLAKLEGNDPHLMRLRNVAVAKDEAAKLPGDPPTDKPPKSAIDDATKKERTARNTSIGAGAGGAATEASKVVPYVGTAIIVGAVILFVVAAVLIARKKKLITANWW